ncbi:MAG: tetratricopeptide repeat protein, partial [Magnetococcales bacterium]|nr:tetratricopeptide repeat protein [Magnetococcales bacterium]
MQNYLNKVQDIQNDIVQSADNRTEAQQVFDRGLELHQSGKFAEAIVCYKKSLEFTPKNIFALGNMGSALASKGELEQAIISYQKAITIKPDYWLAQNNLGYIFYIQGRLEEAVALFNKSIVNNANFDKAHFNLASALQKQGKPDAAIQSYKQAIIINPNYAEAHYMLGTVLQNQDKFKEALLNYQKALAINPKSSDALNNIGVMLQQSGKLDEAIVHYEKAIEIKPDFAQVYYNLGYAKQKQGKLEEAILYHQKSILLNPNLSDAHYNLACALQEQGKYEEAIISYKRALTINPDFVGAHNNIIFCTDLYSPVDSDLFQREREAWNKQYAEPLRSCWPSFNNQQDPDRVLRIGYVGADFVNHSAAHIFGPMILLHDADNFEIYCYAGNSADDDLTQQFREKATGWLSTPKIDDAELATAIKKDGIDILVDLAGHTTGNRLLTFARKPAPIQISAWGYPHGTSMEAMDYIFADDIFIPISERSKYTERIIDLTCVIHLNSTLDFPEIKNLPASKNGYITFGAFNRIDKYSHELYELWAEILKQTPTAKLLIKTGKKYSSNLNEEIKTIFNNLGVEQNRLILMGKSSRTEHLAAHNKVDIMLDPYPHNGGMTTLDSLRMGVGVLTCEGLTRCPTTASILNVLGLNEWRATDKEDYVKKALEFANAIPTLETLRHELRNRFDKSV